jgi:hypothetical protein
MEKNEKVENTIVQTYADDVAKVIENDAGGMIKKIIHGEEEHEAEKKNLSPESKKNKLFMLIGFLLIVFSLMTFSFFFFKKDINTVPVEKQFTPLIFSDQDTFLEVLGLKKDEIVQTVLSEVNNTKVKVGEVEAIYLAENRQVIGLRRFIPLIKGNFIPGDNPLLVNDNFLMGSMLTGLKSTSPNAGNFFILLKVRSTADVFDPMRAWEIKMLSDLHEFFGINTSGDTNYLFTKSFEDGMVENKNARMLYDQNGQLVLMYIFADNNSVIITDSQNVAHEIMLRLASSEKKQ